MDFAGLFPSFDLSALLTRWKDEFEKGQFQFEQTVLDHFSDFVTLVYLNSLESEKEERWATNFLFRPLQDFMCQGDSRDVLTKLGHAEKNPLLCGHNFKNGEPTYSCRDCAYDPTCVLCNDCFQKSVHKNHRYRMSTSGGGGYCDCGDREAWKTEDYACSDHSKKSHDTRTEQMDLDSKMVESVRAVFRCTLKYASSFLTWKENMFLPFNMKRSPRLTKSYLCMLYNDEVHTYEQVISTLQRAVGCTSRQALEFATIVDREGRSCVKTSSKEECDSIKHAIERNTSRHGSKPLKVEVSIKDIASHQQFALKLLSWLQTLSDKYSCLRKILCEVLMEPIPGEIPALSVLEQFIQADTELWKVARVQSHQLLMSCVLKDTESKKQFSVIFTKEHFVYESFLTNPSPKMISWRLVEINQWYSFMVREFSEDDHDHDVSMPSLSVQIFTVPSLCYSRLCKDFLQDDHFRSLSVTRFSLQLFGTPSLARQLISEQDLLSVILKSFLAACEGKKNQQGKLSFSRTDRSNIFKRSVYCLHDLKYALMCKPTKAESENQMDTSGSEEDASKTFCWTDELRENFLKGLVCFLQLLDLIQGMDSVKRQTGQHLEFDPEWEGAFTLQIKLEDILYLFCEWCASDRYLLVEGYKATMEALAKCKETVTREDVTVGPCQASIIKHDVATDAISIHCPLSRFLAALHVHLEKHGLSYTSPELQNPSLAKLAQTMEVVTDVPLDVKEMMEPALRIQVLLAQTHAGMWRRNGYSLQNQVFFYSNLRCRKEMFDRDIVMLQIAASLMSGNEFMIQVINKYNLLSWVKVQYDIPGGHEDSLRQTVTLAEEFLTLIIVILQERYIEGVGVVDEDATIRREVIHLLCISPMAHSRLTKALNEDINHETGLDKVAEQVAVFKRPKVGDNGKFELKPEFYKEYSPYFYHYYKAEQAKSEEMQRQRKKQIDEDQALPPPVPPRFSRQFQSVANILSCDVMIHVMTLILRRTAASSSRSWSEPQLDRILYIIGLALHEQIRSLEEGDKSFDFLTKAVQKSQDPSGREESILMLLQSLANHPNVNTQESKDLLSWVLRIFAKALQMVDDPLAKEYLNGISKSTDLKSDADNKKRAAAAAKRRAKIMAQMAKMQKDFIAENAELFENTSTEGSDPSGSVEMMDMSPGAGGLVALGLNQSSARSCGPTQVTCILCQEEQKISPGGRAMVLAAFVQQSTVLAQGRKTYHSAANEHDPLYTPADLSNGTHTSSCGHVMHHECWQGYFTNIVNRERRRPLRFRHTYSYDVDRMEYLCPLCEGLSNTVIPIVPPLPALIRDTDRKSLELRFDDWLDGIHKTVVNSIQEDEDKESKDELLLFQPCPISTISRMMAESVAKNFQLLWEYVYDDASGCFSEGMREMIRKFAGDVYSFGLGVDPDHENPRVPIMAWNMCAYTIQAIEQELGRLNMSVFETMTDRQNVVLGALVRFAAVTSQVMNPDVIKRHCIRLLSALIPGELERRNKATVCILDVDLFHYLVVLTMTLPALHAQQQRSHISSLPTGGLNDQNALQLVFTAHVIQILVTYKNMLNEASTSSETTPEDEEFLEFYRNLPRVDSTAEPSVGALKEYIRRASLPFLRCCALLYHHITCVPAPEELNSKQSNEFFQLCKYLSLPSNPSHLFTDKGTVTTSLIRSWKENIGKRLSESSELLIEYPLRLNKLIDLPHDYSVLINKASSFTCPKSAGDDSRAPTLCLVCDKMLCSQSYCCQAELDGTSVGAATEHAYQCGASSGIFLRVRECQVLLLSNKVRGCFIPAPFLDMYGETDQLLKRGNPLTLNADKYESVEKIWYQHNIPQTISRFLNSESGNNYLIEWHNL